LLFKQWNSKVEIKTLYWQRIFFILIFLTKDEQKLNTRQFLKHRYLHALAKLAMAEGIELRNLSI